MPLTLANFGVLLVGLTLGSKRGAAAAALYLAWGAMGLPVFSPAGIGGIAQLFGPNRRLPAGVSRWWRLWQVGYRSAVRLRLAEI